VDLLDENIFSQVVDGDEFFSTFCHEGRSAPPGNSRHSPPHGPEHHDDYELHLHAPPHPPPPPRGLRGSYDICGCAPDQRDRTPGPRSHKYLMSRPDRVFAANLTLPTLLANHSLHVHIAKYKLHLPIPGHARDIYFSNLVVNRQRVAFADVVARNGAVHILSRVLNPRPHHPHKPEVINSSNGIYDEDDDDGWEDWEDWLPQWAAEN